MVEYTEKQLEQIKHIQHLIHKNPAELKVYLKQIQMQQQDCKPKNNKSKKD